MKPQDLLPLTWPAEALAVQLMATVQAAPDAATDTWALRVAGRTVHAHLAPSCALQPEPGDRVLCVQGLAVEGAALYILAVLARANAGEADGAADGAAPPARWQLAPGVTLQAQPDALAVHASRLQLRSTEASVHAQEVNVVYRSLHSVGELLRQTVQQVRLVGGLWATAVDQAQHHAGQQTRTVAGVDRLQAQVIDHQADTLLHLQGQQVLANGERVVKMQGAQIHLG